MNEVQLILLPAQSIRPAVIGSWVSAHNDVQLEGYQLYAVQNWIVDRTRPVDFLVVYTGDPNHTVALTPYKPDPSLSEQEAQKQWNNCLALLKQHARPKQTPYGLLMVTSLAQFRSDNTIVLIPNSFAEAKGQLYTNINLLRLGCSGRSALTLEEPSDTTKVKFLTMYHLPSLPSSLFVPTVLELVKLIQAALSVFGYFSLEPDGLFCDDTILGLQKWAVDVGERFVPHFNPTEKVADTTVVSALLSLVLSIRNKLVTLGYNNVVPKDPFLHPQLFLSALGAYTHSQSRSVSQSTTSLASVVPVIQPPQPSSHKPTPHLSLHVPTFLAFSGASPMHSTPTLEVTSPTPTTATYPSPLASATSIAPESSLISLNQISPSPYLTPALLNSISNSFSMKLSHKTSSYLPHPRKLGGKKSSKGPTGDGSDVDPAFDSGEAVSGPSLISGLALGLSGGVSTTPSLGNSSAGAASIFEPMTSLETFIKIIVGDKEWHDQSRSRKISKRGAKKKREAGNSIISLGGLVNLATSDKEDDEEPSRPDGQREETKIKDGGVALISGTVAGSVRALWTGRVPVLVRLRQKIEERRKTRQSLLGAENPSPSTRRKYKHRARVSSIDSLGRSIRSGRLGFGGLWSDGDGTDEQLYPSPSRKRTENISTEEENDPDGTQAQSMASISSGGGGRLWGKGKVRGKLESWAGLSKIDSKLGTSKRTSLDAAMSVARHPSSGEGSPVSLLVSKTSRTTRFSLPGLSSSTQTSGRPDLHDLPKPPAQSPRASIKDSRTSAFANEDDDLLSSGQVSPVSDDGGGNKPFAIFTSQPALDSIQPKKGFSLNADDPEYQRKVDEFVRKRPWGNRFTATRVSSWSDPVSARDDVEHLEHKSDGPEPSAQKPLDHPTKPNEKHARGRSHERSSISNEVRRDASSVSGKITRQELRRRSFHDFAEFRHTKVLSTERMKIDVELCGQLLIMSRREEHLKNVVATLQVITSRLASTNSRLREEYQAHLRDLAKVEVRTKVIADIDAEMSKADKITQATNTLWYESEQFNLGNLWHVASSSREKVFTYRDKVFGEGRKLPAGSHGAHGRFNRLQWTLDGQEKLVDLLGRTESEVEEEENLADEEHQQVALDEEQDAVSNHSMKPVWLLRFFTSWISRWGTWTDARPSRTLGTSVGNNNSLPQSPETEG